MITSPPAMVSELRDVRAAALRHCSRVDTMTKAEIDEIRDSVTTDLVGMTGRLCLAMGVRSISAVARPPCRLGNLPAETSSFIGRRREVAEVKKRLTDTRLVGLVGPGGVGRTRLAIRMATHLGRSFPDGAWLVELAEVRSPAAVGDAVAAALDHLVPPYHPCSCLHPTPSHTAICRVLQLQVSTVRRRGSISPP